MLLTVEQLDQVLQAQTVLRKKELIAFFNPGFNIEKQVVIHYSLAPVFDLQFLCLNSLC